MKIYIHLMVETDRLIDYRVLLAHFHAHFRFQSL
jgi:hypothetical protein